MYSGIVNIYKEQGFTSHDVVAKLRGIYGQKKVGHTGTLDPMAEGVLIVCLGQATKLSDLILTSKKQYIATMKLGISTDTDDVTGNVIGEYKDEYLRSLAYMGSEDFSMDDYIASLKKMAELHCDILLPGHYYVYYGDVDELCRKAAEMAEKMKEDGE
jgi:hypothetical protein